MKNYLVNLSLFSLTLTGTLSIALILSSHHFQLIEAIRTSASGNDGLVVRTTRKPDYSDVYEKIDDNDIFKNVRRIMRIGDPANGVPIMAPFKRDHQFDAATENELGNVEHQRVEGLDQFVTKSSLIYSNNEKFDFSLLWPKITFVSRHSSTRNYRVFYSNYTFIGCTLKGEADVRRTSIEDNCFKLKDLRLTLHFKNYDVNVVTTSNNENDKEVARTAKHTLDRYIKQEYTLGLEKPAYELEQKIKEYFGTYRCLLQEELPIQRPSRKNNRDDRAFIDFDREIFTEKPQSAYQINRPVQNNYDERDVYSNNYNNNNNRQPGNDQQGRRPSQSGYDREDNDDFNRQPNNQNQARPNSQSINNSYDDRRPSVSSASQPNNQRNPYEQYESQNNRNTPKPDPDPIYFPTNRDDQQLYNTNSQQNRPVSTSPQTTQRNPVSYYPQSNRSLSTTSSTRRPIQPSSNRPGQSQSSVNQSQNRPVTSIQNQQQSQQEQQNRPSLSSQVIQTRNNPVHRTTITQIRTTTQSTQPQNSYYEYSRLI